MSNNHSSNHSLDNIFSAPIQQHDGADLTGNPWQPSFFRRAPWLGLAAMLGALMGVLAAVVVLYVSNNQPIYSWNVQPTVCLAIASAATNIFLHFALTEAVTVAWWKRALQQDTTIADMHRRWETGQSLWAALTSGRHFSLIALASILVALVPINGPLLQRASQIRNGHFEQDTHVYIHIAHEIPDGYTGYLSSRAFLPTLLTSPFAAVVQNFDRRSSIPMNNSGCKGICDARITGAGLVANCSESRSPFHLGGDDLKDLSEGESDKIVQEMLNGTNIFGVYMKWPTYGPEADLMSWPVMTPGTFNLGVQYKAKEDCKGTLVVRNCTFRPSIVSYPVSIDGNTSSISLTAGTTIFDDELLEITAVPRFVSTQASSSLNISTYAGFFKSLSDIYDSSLLMNYGSIGYQILGYGALYNRYLDESNDLTTLQCNMTFTDPTDDIIADIRELMFRTAIASANVTKAADVFAAQEFLHPLVYTSSYTFLGLAVLFSVLAWIATLVIFRGWWYLGRAVSMSPIETARAFGGLGVNTTDSNAPMRDVLKEIGQQKVRYGAMTTGLSEELSESTEKSTYLLMDEPERIRRPIVKEKFF